MSNLTWLQKFDDEDYAKLLQLMSSQRSTLGLAHPRGQLVNEAHTLVTMTRDGILTKESGRHLLFQVLDKIPATYKKPSASHTADLTAILGGDTSLINPLITRLRDRCDRGASAKVNQTLMNCIDAREGHITWQKVMDHHLGKREVVAVPPVEPVKAPVQQGAFIDGITLQQKRRLELELKWGPLQKQLAEAAQKKAEQSSYSYIRRTGPVRPARVDNRRKSV